MSERVFTAEVPCQAERLERLLRPESICVIGGQEAESVIEQCQKMNYSGALYPVHPSRRDMHGVPCLRDLESLPEAPDAVFVGVRRDLTIATIERLAARGAGGALCYASGFSESGAEGKRMQRALVQAAGEMPVLGPNCYGLLNYLDGVPLWPDQHGGRRVSRGVALICQSSNIALNLTMQQRGLPIAMVVTLGNRALLGAADIIRSLLGDNRITAIGLVLETFDEAEALSEVFCTAGEQGVGIAALKLGKSPAGASATLSHTASMAGEDAACETFLEHLGVAKLRSLPSLLEALKVLHFHGFPEGRSIGSMSCSGGEAALVADRVTERRLELRPLKPSEAQHLASTLNDLVVPSNPLDYHTFIWGDFERLKATFTAMLRCGFDMVLLIIDLPRGDRCTDGEWRVTLDAFAEASAETNMRGCVVCTLPESMTEALADEIIARGIVPLFGLDDGLDALEALADVADLRAPGPRELLPGRVALAKGTAIGLSEWDAKQQLAERGLSIPTGRLVQDAESARRAAQSLGFPVVLKATGVHLTHKTEAHAVRVNMQSEHEVQACTEELLALSPSLLIEEMITDGIAEVILGIRRDPQVGLILMLGSGGELAELVADRELLLIPASRRRIESALAKLKVWKLLCGHRNRAPGDIEALLDSACRLQEFALLHAETLLELEINPLIVRPRGKGATAVDALMRFIEKE